MFHSALSSMGWVEGGADAVIDGFLETVGPAGTVVAPTLSTWQPEDHANVWDLWSTADTPTYCGAIPEAFRRRPEALRSNHYTHSVAAIGPRALEVTRAHGEGGQRRSPWGDGAFAGQSPWQRFYDWNVPYLLIGVTFQRNTMVHFVETQVAHRAVARARPELRGRLLQELRGWGEPGVWTGIHPGRRLLAEDIFAERGLVSYGSMGSATVRFCRIGEVVDAWIALVEAEPEQWCSEEFVQWLQQIPSRTAVARD